MIERYSLFLVLFLLVKVIPAQGVEVIETAPYQPPVGLQAAIEILNQTETGRLWYRKAIENQVPIREGQISKTEITATRTVEGNEERLHFVAQVLISQDKDPVFQALDLAHELVHAVNDKKNPFDPHMSATEYVEHGIESEGGEANAIAEECKVGEELIQHTQARSGLKTRQSRIEDSVDLIKARCRVVWKLNSDQQKWTASFYQLGHHYRHFVQEWLSTQPGQVERESWRQKLAQRSPVFSSAAAHKPYPVALLEEYFEVTRVICDRAQAAMQSRIGRGIAAQVKRFSGAFAGFEARCRSLPSREGTRKPVFGNE